MTSRVAGVDADALVFIHRLGTARCAAQQGTDAGQQLVQVIGLEHVVVGPGIQPLDALRHGIARGGHQHGGAVLAGAQVAQHGQTIALGQAQVQQHQVIRLGAQGRVGRVAIARPVHRVLLGAQQVQHGFTDHGIVFNKQQAHGKGAERSVGQKCRKWAGCQG